MANILIDFTTGLCIHLLEFFLDLSLSLEEALVVASRALRLEWNQ